MPACPACDAALESELNQCGKVATCPDCGRPGYPLHDCLDDMSQDVPRTLAPEAVDDTGEAP